MSIRGKARRVLFGIDAGEVLVRRRGFHVADESARARMERVGREFIGGYHAALEEDGAAAIAARLDSTAAAEFRGFAYEGAAMALALLDAIPPFGRRFREFLEGPGDPHAYMCHVGAGWAVARLPWLRGRLPRVLDSFQTLGRWLVMDGYGFHEGYFSWSERVLKQRSPAGLTGYAARAFDQGLGRSLWFVDGMDVARIPRTIAGFSRSRQSDLWSGVGLASGYAGGAGESQVMHLAREAGEHVRAYQQGVAFAAKARLRAMTPAGHLEATCRAACGLSAGSLAALCDETLKGLSGGDSGDAAVPAYEMWRRRIQTELAGVRR